MTGLFLAGRASDSPLKMIIIKVCTPFRDPAICRVGAQSINLVHYYYTVKVSVPTIVVDTKHVIRKNMIHVFPISMGEV